MQLNWWSISKAYQPTTGHYRRYASRVDALTQWTCESPIRQRVSPKNGLGNYQFRSINFRQVPIRSATHSWYLFTKWGKFQKPSKAYPEAKYKK